MTDRIKENEKDWLWEILNKMVVNLNNYKHFHPIDGFRDAKHTHDEIMKRFGELEKENEKLFDSRLRMQADVANAENIANDLQARVKELQEALNICVDALKPFSNKDCQRSHTVVLMKEEVNKAKDALSNPLVKKYVESK